MRQDSCEYECTLDDRFFTDIDAGDIQKGHLNVRLSVKKTIGAYMLNFHIEGAVTVVCDRCLDELELPVNTDNALKVKLGPVFRKKKTLSQCLRKMGILMFHGSFMNLWH